MKYKLIDKVLYAENNGETIPLTVLIGGNIITNIKKPVQDFLTNNLQTITTIKKKRGRKKKSEI